MKCKYCISYKGGKCVLDRSNKHKDREACEEFDLSIFIWCHGASSKQMIHTEICKSRRNKKFMRTCNKCEIGKLIAGVV